MKEKIKIDLIAFVLWFIFSFPAYLILGGKQWLAIVGMIIGYQIFIEIKHRFF